ncbi:4'-phosphopantetheinyl transferase superfamily protein (plasmid) [Ruegeria conchae]|uniref:4'-phosphopantetheinyl transferase family protein n=1 Tax=Ruegeria conchae TaxID=981384 RepID=UPI0021A2A15F|nr:4'-phosphopantetheinyl transferase superfamily protein [Ruegeria conchae]UWR05132.1 4'-phosphopantetheinyl transferase superfamily protein [Ruegeria conchae]
MNRFETIKAELHKMLGPDIGIGVTDPKASGAALLSGEIPAMKRAVETRRLEFAAGRSAARQAMRKLNLNPVAIPMADDRSPVWPDGVIGSITHCNDICIAIVAHKGSEHGIGIDIEPYGPLDPDLEAVICTPSEREWLDTQNAERRRHLAKQIFCVKESIYKAIHPLIGQMIEFQDVEFLRPLQPNSPIALTIGDRTTRLELRLMSQILGDKFFSFAALDNMSAMSLLRLESVS